MATVETEQLLTLDEYFRLADQELPSELVRGRAVSMNPPIPYHGFVCGKVDRLVGGFIETHDLGYPMCNDSGVVTEHDPDTLRGADFAFYSYQRVPKGSLAQRGYLAVVPDLIFEVKSPDDRWKDILAKVAEYLNAGVTVVCVLDPGRRAATIYQADEPEQTFGADQTLAFPELLPGFSVKVSQFFE